jgi:hypothetical protein
MFQLSPDEISQINSGCPKPENHNFHFKFTGCLTLIWDIPRIFPVQDISYESPNQISLTPDPENPWVEISDYDSIALSYLSPRI